MNPRQNHVAVNASSPSRSTPPLGRRRVHRRDQRRRRHEGEREIARDERDRSGRAAASRAGMRRCRGGSTAPPEERGERVGPRRRIAPECAAILRRTASSKPIWSAAPSTEQLDAPGLPHMPISSSAHVSSGPSRPTTPRRSIAPSAKYSHHTRTCRGWTAALRENCAALPDELRGARLKLEVGLVLVDGIVLAEEGVEPADRDRHHRRQPRRQYSGFHASSRYRRHSAAAIRVAPRLKDAEGEGEEHVVPDAAAHSHCSDGPPSPGATPCAAALWSISRTVVGGGCDAAALCSPRRCGRAGR